MISFQNGIRYHACFVIVRYDVSDKRWRIVSLSCSYINLRWFKIKWKKYRLQQTSVALYNKKLLVSRKCDTFSFGHRKINSQDQFSENFYWVSMINLVRISFLCMLNSFHKLLKFVSEKAIEIITEKKFQKFRNVYYDITTFIKQYFNWL